MFIYFWGGGLSRFVGVTLSDSLSTLKKLWIKLLFLLRCYRKMLSASVVAIVAIVSGCLLPARVVNWPQKVRLGSGLKRRVRVKST